MILMIVNDLKRSYHCDHFNSSVFRGNIPTLLSNNKCTIYKNINDHKKPETSTLIFSFSHFWIMTIMFMLTLLGCCGHLICKVPLSHNIKRIVKIKADFDAWADQRSPQSYQIHIHQFEDWHENQPP